MLQFEQSHSATGRAMAACAAGAACAARLLVRDVGSHVGGCAPTATPTSQSFQARVRGDANGERCANGQNERAPKAPVASWRTNA
jgi:hypothetical protein